MSSTYPFEVGAYQCQWPRTVSAPAEAMEWFNRGVRWAYAFNHEEAIWCFERSIACSNASWRSAALGHLAVAWCLGPNYNDPDVSTDDAAKARSHLSSAEACLERHYGTASVDALEAAMVTAQRVRFSEELSAGERVRQYAERMVELQRDAWQDDPDVAAWCVEALMQRKPWQLYDKEGNEVEGTREIVELVEWGLSRWADHPGLLHFCIHALEMSPHPERALDAARRLEGCAGKHAGHLLHMPSHIYVLCGLYQDAMRVNVRAWEGDRKFRELRGGRNFYTLYRLHDVHFLAFAAMLAGCRQDALRAADAVDEELSEDVVRFIPDLVESFSAVRIHVYVRFGMWSELLEMTVTPADDDLYVCRRATELYGRAVALAVLGRVTEAESEQEKFKHALECVPVSRTLFNNTVRDILEVGVAMLDGEIKYRKGLYDEAFERLREAVRLDDALPYDEPWGWMQPTRHALGALLLEQGAVGEALEVYLEDLSPGKHPQNVWALSGLVEALQRTEVRTPEQEEKLVVAQRELATAMTHCDIPLTSSCFCRVEACGGCAGE